MTGYQYRPRGMPARFMDGAPDVVKRNVLDVFKITPAAPLDFDVMFKPEPNPDELTGLDFGHDGARGCHFFLKPHEARAYRERNRRKRVAWRDLPEATQRAIVAYCEED